MADNKFVPELTTATLAQSRRWQLWVSAKPLRHLRNSECTLRWIFSDESRRAARGQRVST